MRAARLTPRALAPGRKRGVRGLGSNGAVLWRGMSRLEPGVRIVVIATSVRPKSRSQVNRKTGDLVQTWILLEDVSPIDALRTHADSAVCGDCPLRPRGEESELRACYVHIGMVQQIWAAYKDGLYPEISDYGPHPFRNRIVRLGSYGDPAAVPYDEVWRWVLTRSGAAGWRGYTHQWRTCDPRLSSAVQASCDSPRDLKAARQTGTWRAFRTRLPDEPLRKDEVACPASAEAGKRSTCENCSLCNGSDERGDARPDVAIVAHGWHPALVAYYELRGAAPPPSPRRKSLAIVT